MKARLVLPHRTQKQWVVGLIATGLLFSSLAQAQNLVVNSSFEDTTATTDQLNLTDSAFNNLMNNVFAIGVSGNMDIMNTGQNGGTWSVGMANNYPSGYSAGHSF